MRRRGLKVPEEFAVVGFDGIAFGAFTAPTLTTIDSSREELGKLAMQAIIDAIEKRADRKITCYRSALWFANCAVRQTRLRSE